jgi:uncharacterized membrane protein YdbT with pleckstrin-like domain
MPYPKRLLNTGEELALDLKPHWWFFSKQIIAGTALLVLFVLVWQINNDVTWVIWLILAVVWAGWLGLVYLDWHFTHFVVTNNRVIYRTGVLAKRGVEIPLARVNNINFQQSIWERVIGAGDLEIESAGEHGMSTFEDVRHPDGVQQEIYRQMESNAKRQASWATGAAPVAPTPSPERSIPEQIQQLADLRDRGVISPAEFEAKKAQLLERM